MSLEVAQAPAAFGFVAHQLTLAFPQVPAEQVQAALAAALAARRLEHSDFGYYLPAMQRLASVLFANWERLDVEAYLETLYCAAKHADFLQRRRPSHRLDSAILEAAARITFERTFDVDVIRCVVTNPEIWEWIACDDTGAAENFCPAPESLYMLVRDGRGRGSELLGLFILTPRNSVMWEIHTCLLPQAWGIRARAAYLAGLQWLAANSSCRKVIGHIRTTNTLALQIAERAGLRRIGLNTKCVRKDGELLDQWIVGMELETNG